MTEHSRRSRRRSQDVAPIPDSTSDPRADREAAPLPPRFADDVADARDLKGVEKLLDKLLSVQRPLVVRQIRGLRARFPDATPAEIARKIEVQYLNSVTLTGGGAGAAAVVPGVGTIASAGITGAETATFLEMTALYGQAIAELHGIHTSDPVRARTLVMALMLGDSGKRLISQFTGQAMGTKTLADRNRFWGEIVTKSMPNALVGQLAERIRKAFVRRFLRNASAGTIGRLIPFGVGAVIGGAGNRILAGGVVKAAHEAFGPAPSMFPLDLDAPSKKGRGAFIFFSPKALRSGAGRGEITDSSR